MLARRSGRATGAFILNPAAPKPPLPLPRQKDCRVGLSGRVRAGHNNIESGTGAAGAANTQQTGRGGISTKPGNINKGLKPSVRAIILPRRNTVGPGHLISDFHKADLVKRIGELGKHRRHNADRHTLAKVDQMLPRERPAPHVICD